MASLQSQETNVIISLSELLGKSCGQNSEGFDYESIAHLWYMYFKRPFD